MKRDRQEEDKFPADMVVTVVLKDGRKSSIGWTFAKQCKTLSDVLEDCPPGGECDIPLVNMSYETFERICLYLSNNVEWDEFKSSEEILDFMLAHEFLHVQTQGGAMRTCAKLLYNSTLHDSPVVSRLTPDMYRTYYLPLVPTYQVLQTLVKDQPKFAKVVISYMASAARTKWFSELPDDMDDHLIAEAAVHCESRDYRILANDAYEELCLSRSDTGRGGYVNFPEMLEKALIKHGSLAGIAAARAKRAKQKKSAKESRERKKKQNTANMSRNLAEFNRLIEPLGFAAMPSFDDLDRHLKLPKETRDEIKDWFRSSDLIKTSDEMFQTVQRHLNARVTDLIQKKNFGKLYILTTVAYFKTLVQALPDVKHTAKIVKKRKTL